MKKGDVFYKAWLNLESCLSERCSLEVEEWHVTKTDKNGTYLTQKVIGITYGKKSTTNGDFGFLSPIHSIYKDFIKPSENIIDKKYFKTKVSAFRSVKPVLDRKQKEIQKILNRVNKSIKKTN
jgi:predicted transglutaminase-like cysteine proteinase